MQITMAILAHNLAHLAPEVEFRARDNRALEGVRLVPLAAQASASGTRFNPAYAYLGHEEEFARACETAADWPANALIVAPTGDVARAMNAALGVFERYAGWAARLNEIVMGEGGLQELVTASFEVFGANPMYIVDTAFTTLAWSREVPPDALDAGWASIAGKGHADLREINLLRETGTLTYIHEFASASFFDYPDFRYPAIIAHARLDGQRAASLVVLEANSKLTRAHLDLADHFARTAGLLLRRNARAGQAPQATQTSFLLDQLLGKSYNEAVVDFHLALLGWRRMDRYRIARIRPAEAKGRDDALAMGLNATLLQSMLPDSQSLVYEDSVVVVIHIRATGEGRSDLEDRLQEFLSQNNQQAGLSCIFDDFAQLSAHFQQATAALALGPAETPRVCLYRYEQVAARHLIRAATQDLSWRVFCHPAALRLAARDRGHQTEYIKTLQTYLSLDRSLVRSAQALHIHRNTLIYRLERIDRLLEVDLDDANTRLHLLLSCQIIQ